jgi:ATP-dependent DNA helicase RecQ
VLRVRWGHDDFRSGQWDVIERVLSGRDVLAILPTGGGKSVCYQLPALLTEGLTLVVSPLIALMQDQVAALRARGIEAAFINSSLGAREIDQRWTDAEHGRYRLLYIAPERLETDRFLARAERMRIALLAVDEAHCISEWGHDFRPAYLEIPQARKTMGDPPTVALTATATPEARKDIVRHLELRSPAVIVRGFDRPNLVWSIFQTENKRSRVLDVIDSVPGPGIIYSATRKGVEDWARWLNRRNVSSASYHGGMKASARALMQERWISGHQRIMVATNAFGMGIDKADVRFVLHAELPSTLEGYYQEAGRAGRDGKTAYAVLLYHSSDEETPHRLIDESHPSAAEVRTVYEAVCNLAQIAVGALQDGPVAVDAAAVSRLTGFAYAKIRTAVDQLARQESWRVMPARKHYGLIRFTQPASHIRAYAAGLTNASLAGFVRELLRAVHADAFSSWWEIDLRLLERRSGLQRERLLRGLEYCSERDLFEWREPDRALRIELLHPRSSKLPVDVVRVRRARKRAEARLEDMIRYARSQGCRRRSLLTYFGEDAPERCETCDACLGRHEPFVLTAEDERVVHHLLHQISAKRPRGEWFAEGAPPRYRIDRLINWMINEGYLRQMRPLGNAFELTEKAESALAALE